jgi:hypothetical protein
MQLFGHTIGHEMTDEERKERFYRDRDKEQEKLRKRESKMQHRRLKIEERELKLRELDLKARISETQERRRRAQAARVRMPRFRSESASGRMRLPR